jgi:hypothetical protein
MSPLNVKVADAPLGRTYPPVSIIASAVPFPITVTGDRVALGSTAKTSEIESIDARFEIGTYPPEREVVDDKSASLKRREALPELVTLIESVDDVRVIPVISNFELRRIWSHQGAA